MITKETYTWVDKLLKRKTANISDKEYDRLVKDYFKEDKIDWFEEKEEKKEWDSDKVKQFWQLIRKYVMPNGKKNQLLDFSFFIFPVSEFSIFDRVFYNILDKSSSMDFWHNVDDKEFKEVVNFTSAIFLQFIPFYEVNFKKAVDFSHVNFSNVKFDDVKFNDDVKFAAASFLEKSSFSEVEFSKEVDFMLVSFSERITFFSCYFRKRVIFYATRFSKDSEFNYCHFLESVDFSQSVFKNASTFRRGFFKKANFSFTFFEDVSFIRLNKKDNYTESPILFFQDVFFNENTIFQNTNLDQLTLINCDVINVTFSRCKWNDKTSRIKLKNDLSGEYLSRQTRIEQFIDAENHYRQLKKNFDTSKNWELSGKAYVSEMEMRKYRLLLEKNYLQWTIYWFYSTLGGYTQNFIRPLIILLSSIVIFAGIYFYLDFPNHFSFWNIQSVIESSISESFQKSFDAAFPFFKPVHEYQYWWIRYFQTFFCGTLLTFFILALRKRFKQ